jgi:hypothetical protein
MLGKEDGSMKRISVKIDDMERSVSPPRQIKRDVTPHSQKSLVDREERRRRRAASQSASPTPFQLKHMLHLSGSFASAAIR